MESWSEKEKERKRERGEVVERGGGKERE